MAADRAEAITAAEEETRNAWEVKGVHNADVTTRRALGPRSSGNQTRPRRFLEIYFNARDPNESALTPERIIGIIISASCSTRSWSSGAGPCIDSRSTRTRIRSCTRSCTFPCT